MEASKGNRTLPQLHANRKVSGGRRFPAELLFSVFTAVSKFGGLMLTGVDDWRSSSLVT